MIFRNFIIASFLITAALGTTGCRATGPEDEKSVSLPRETVLRDNLYQLRKSIDVYSAERGALPQALDDLVKAGYIREIPDDPVTERKDWKVVIADDPNAKGRKGIADVHSASAEKSSEGSLYSDW
jgi:general secretion pathway protein G